MTRLKNLGPVMQFERQKQGDQKNIPISAFRSQITERDGGTHYGTCFFPPPYSAVRSQSTERDGGTYNGTCFSAPIFRREVPKHRERERERAEYITYLPIGTSAHFTCSLYPRPSGARPTWVGAYCGTLFFPLGRVCVFSHDHTHTHTRTPTKKNEAN